MSNGVKQIAGSLVAGILITGTPLVLANAFWGKEWFKLFWAACDWPMQFAQGYGFPWLRMKELNRLLAFFSLNVVTWAFIAELFYQVSRAVLSRTTTARNTRGN